MRRRQSLMRAVLVVAVALSLCAMSSPSPASVIWGGGRRATLAASRDPARASWRVVIALLLRAGWP